MIDRQSPEWPRAKAWLEAKIETHRNTLEGANCGIKEADHLRGRIMALRAIIAEVEPEAPRPLVAATAVPGAPY